MHLRANKKTFNDKLYHICVASLLNMIKFVIECPFIHAFEDALNAALNDCFVMFFIMMFMHSFNAVFMQINRMVLRGGRVQPVRCGFAAGRLVTVGANKGQKWFKSHLDLHQIA